jgi:hypothetical protein
MPTQRRQRVTPATKVRISAVLSTRGQKTAGRTIAGGICEKNWFLFSSSRCVIKHTETQNLKCTCTMLELFPSGIDGIHHCMCPHAAVQLPTKSKEVPLTGVLGGRMLRPLRPSSAAVEASHSAPAPSTSTGRLSLSYHSLRSLILASAGTNARLCAGEEVLPE